MRNFLRERAQYVLIPTALMSAVLGIYRLVLYWLE